MNENSKSAPHNPQPESRTPHPATRTPNPEPQIPIITIQGPTAVGKSTVALKLAEELQTEIISADSRKVYKLLNIGTAKPSQIERERVKYHLIDIVFPNEEYSAGNFAKDAEEIIQNLNKQKKLPLVVGGTGFYIKSLLNGIFKAPIIPKEIRTKLRQTAQEKGSQYLYEYLKKVDPDSAERANPNDLNRIIRALEIYEVTGKTITQLWNEQIPKKKNIQSYNIFVTDDRTVLYERINKRVDKMIELGLVKEMKTLLEMGYNRDDPGMNTVGYKELFSYFSDEKKLEKCVEDIKKNTRNYAKRQFTWFRKIDFDLTLQANNINFSNILKEIIKFQNMNYQGNE